MPKTAKKSPSLLAALADKSTPAEQRYLLLRAMINDGKIESIALIHEFLENVSLDNEETVYREKLKEVEELLQLMQSGPMRDGTFIKQVQVGKVQAAQALVVLDDGTRAYTTVPEESLAKELLVETHRIPADEKGRAPRSQLRPDCREHLVVRRLRRAPRCALRTCWPGSLRVR